MKLKTLLVLNAVVGAGGGSSTYPHKLHLIMVKSSKPSKNLATNKKPLTKDIVSGRLSVVPSGLEPDRALKNCPVGNFSEGDRLLRWPSDPEEDEDIIIMS